MYRYDIIVPQTDVPLAYCPTLTSLLKRFNPFNTDQRALLLAQYPTLTKSIAKCQQTKFPPQDMSSLSLGGSVMLRRHDCPHCTLTMDKDGSVEQIAYCAMHTPEENMAQISQKVDEKKIIVGGNHNKTDIYCDCGTQCYATYIYVTTPGRYKSDVIWSLCCPHDGEISSHKITVLNARIITPKLPVRQLPQAPRQQS